MVPTSTLAGEAGYGQKTLPPGGAVKRVFQQALVLMQRRFKICYT